MNNEKKPRRLAAPRRVAADDAYNFAEYGIDIENRIIHIDDDITAQVTGRVIKGIQMMLVKDKAKDISIYINSDGGDIYAGLGLYSYLKTLTTLQVNMYNIGRAISAASIIFLAGDKRYMYDNTVFMFHSCSSGAKGKAFVVITEAEELKRIYNEMCDIYGNHTTNNSSQWKKILKHNDMYYRKDEALELGIVHKIILDNEEKEV